MKRSGPKPANWRPKTALVAAGEVAAESPFKRETGRPPAYHGQSKGAVMRRDGLIETILAHPEAPVAELATLCGMSYQAFWITLQSDEMQAKLAEKRDQLSPLLTATLAERAKPIMIAAYERLQDKVPVMSVPELLSTVSTVGRNLGMGAPVAQASTQVNFVVQVPPRAKTADEWQASLADHGITIDVQPTEV